MAISADLAARSGEKCELCGSTDGLEAVEVSDAPVGFSADVVLCATCAQHSKDPGGVDAHHWRCLTDSMWSQVPAVQVLSARLLNKISAESWAQDALDMLYLDDELQSWVEAGNVDEIVHLDSNGVRLQAGDSVTIIKDLDVKGTSFVAKRGTPVRGISLTSNPEHIEGRVNGTKIVILTKYVKKN